MFLSTVLFLTYTTDDIILYYNKRSSYLLIIKRLVIIYEQSDEYSIIKHTNKYFYEYMMMCINSEN